MTKKEAAQALNVSDRAINRYVRAGKLSVKYAKNEQGSFTGVYNANEVAALKVLMKQPPPPRVKLEPDKKRGRPPKSEALTRRDTGTALARVEVGDAIISLAKSAVNTGPLREPLTLTLDDAVKACPGYSRGFLLEAIHEGRLKAIKRRGWVIKVDDLRAWVKKL